MISAINHREKLRNGVKYPSAPIAPSEMIHHVKFPAPVKSVFNSSANSLCVPRAPVTTRSSPIITSAYGIALSDQETKILWKLSTHRDEYKEGHKEIGEYDIALRHLGKAKALRNAGKLDTEAIAKDQNKKD